MKRPYITIKFAQTLDGKIAAVDGSSRWISSPESRKFAHRLRAENDAVLVGIGTVLKDDPSLTARLAKGRNPARVILDSKLRTPFNSKIAKKARSTKTIIITGKNTPGRKIRKFEKKGIKFLISSNPKRGNISIDAAIRLLYKNGMKKILVEGGRDIITSFLRAGLADRIIAVISPKILGNGKESIGELGIKNIKGALKIKPEKIIKAGGDLIYTALVKK